MNEVIVPDWQINADAKVAMIKDYCKVIPWFKGTDTVRAKLQLEAHFELLKPFGLKAAVEIKVVTSWAAAWAAARAAARDAAWGAAWAAARAAARERQNAKLEEMLLKVLV